MDRVYNRQRRREMRMTYLVRKLRGSNHLKDLDMEDNNKMHVKSNRISGYGMNKYGSGQ
jgi:hypothetical protein